MSKTLIGLDNVSLGVKQNANSPLACNFSLKMKLLIQLESLAPPETGAPVE